MNKLTDFISDERTKKASGFLLFTIALTAIISAQNFFFQNIIENGISKRDIIAQETLTVIDIKKTEQHKKEVAQKIDPVLTTAEDEFIRNNLETLQNSIIQIRNKDTSVDVKKEELGILFDISDTYKKNFTINFLLKADEKTLNEVFSKSSLTLSNILNKGISEKEYEKNTISTIVKSNIVSNVSKREISVISSILEQVIVPNLVIDEFATEIAKKNAQNSIKPYETVFKKGEKILFEGEPVTKLKRDALRQAGYNVYELNAKGLGTIFVFVLLATILYLR